MGEYPTVKQERLIDDMLQFTIRYIEYFSEDLLNDYLVIDKLNFTEKYRSITMNEQVQILISSLTRLCAVLNNLCNSIDRASWDSCYTLRQVLLNSCLRDIEREYLKVSEYVKLPSFSSLKEHILTAI